jgi:hypothetical protein
VRRLMTGRAVKQEGRAPLPKTPALPSESRAGRVARPAEGGRVMRRIRVVARLTEGGRVKRSLVRLRWCERARAVVWASRIRCQARGPA